MSLRNDDSRMTALVERLTKNSSLNKLYHEHRDGYPLPSSKVLAEIVEIMRSIVFPGYFGKSNIILHSLEYPIGASLQTLRELLVDQDLAGLCFSECDCDDDKGRSL